MPIIYDNKKIIPAPLVSISKSYLKSKDNTIIGSVFDIVLTGKIVDFKGSPNSSGEFWDQSGYPPDEVLTHDQRLGSILRKQEALRSLFSTEGRFFEIQPLDGSTAMRCNPRIKSPITFTDGLWVQDCDYTIALEADVLYINGQPVGEDNFANYIQDASENWSVDINEDGGTVESQYTFKLTHNISAVGKRFYKDDGTLAMEAWEQAREFVVPRLGLSFGDFIGNPANIPNSSGVFNFPDTMAAYNHMRALNIDKLGGEYGVTETWILSNDSANEDFTLTTTYGIEDGLTRVTIEGQIQGLESRSPDFYTITQSKYEAALNKFNTVKNQFLTRAQTYTGMSLHPTPLVERVGKNPKTGIITYAYDYDNRATNLIPGALSEIITVIDNIPGDVFATIPILERANGPILQNIRTVTESQRQLTIEVLMPPISGTFDLAAAINSKPDVSSIVNTVKETLSYSKIFTNPGGTESWSPKNGRYSKNISWTFEP
jgi:hypothetical protein